MDSIIEVKNLGKKYNIGERQGYVALRDVLTSIIKSPFSWFGSKVKSALGVVNKNEFWALEDINFTVEKGEVLGIIGRNGAGKSTLLKVLSQITPPTTGEIKLKGRVCSLLEVGTGFHPELTGRENIFLNGAILGMRKKEIEKKFNEIVEFAGIEKFLDTPVKRYSSGMYVRLAFAVAAHLEPEILIIDEVLAVGDAEFQKKCLGKMEDVTRKEGRTVLFVSHNMGAIAQLCTRTVVLKDGKIIFVGPTDEAISFYLDKNSKDATVFNLDKNSLVDKNQLVSAFNAGTNNKIQNEYRHDDEIKLIFEVYLPKWDEMLEVGLSPCDKFGKRIFTIDIALKDYYNGDPFVKFEVKIPPHFLTPGNYSWMIFVHYPLITLHDYQEELCKFTIIESGSKFSRYVGYDYGSVYPPAYLIQKI